MQKILQFHRFFYGDIFSLIAPSPPTRIVKGAWRGGGEIIVGNRRAEGGEERTPWGVVGAPLALPVHATDCNNQKTMKVENEVLRTAKFAKEKL